MEVVGLRRDGRQGERPWAPRSSGEPILVRLAALDDPHEAALKPLVRKVPRQQGRWEGARPLASNVERTSSGGPRPSSRPSPPAARTRCTPT
eukprot:12816174-Alexandrium_andersonii.AAC.1